MLLSELLDSRKCQHTFDMEGIYYDVSNTRGVPILHEMSLTYGRVGL